MADDQHHVEHHPIQRTADVFRLTLAALIALALIVFALANTDDTRIDYLVDDTTAPLIAVMAGSAVAGALIAALLRRRRH
jgi:uncharacterized integral membrane protein